jgi:hypothetical protein
VGGKDGEERKIRRRKEERNEEKRKKDWGRERKVEQERAK